MCLIWEKDKAHLLERSLPSQIAIEATGKTLTIQAAASCLYDHIVLINEHMSRDSEKTDDTLQQIQTMSFQYSPPDITTGERAAGFSQNFTNWTYGVFEVTMTQKRKTSLFDAADITHSQALFHQTFDSSGRVFDILFVIFFPKSVTFSSVIDRKKKKKLWMAAISV